MSIILSGSGSTGSDISSVLTYEWKDSSNNIIGTLSAVTVTSADTYSLTVTDSYNNQTDIEYFQLNNITGDPIADIESITTEIGTSGQQIILDGTGSLGQSILSVLTYQWTTGDGTFFGDTSGPTATAVSGGTYTLTVTDTYNQCTDSTTQLLTVDIAPITPPTADITGDTDIDCITTSIILDGGASYSATGGAVSYLWSTTETTSTITVTSADTYTLTVTDTSNGLTSLSAATFTVSFNQTDPNPTITPSATELTNIVTSITLTAVEDVDYTYLWTTIDGNITSGSLTSGATINAAGTYNLSVTDNTNGCTDTDSQVITEIVTLPIARISGPTVINCNTGNNITLLGTLSTGVSLTYEWKDGSSNIIGTDSTQVVTSADTYTLTVEDSSFNTDDDTQGVTVNTTTPSVEIVKTPDVTVIDDVNTFITLSGPSGTTLSYSWNTNPIQTTKNIIITKAGAYTLTIIDNINGCTNNTTVFITKSTTVRPPTPIITGDTEINCIITQVVLDGSTSHDATGGTVTYLWSTTETTPTITVNDGGTYSLNVTDSNGLLNDAPSSITVNLNQTDPNPIITASSTILTGGVTEATLTAVDNSDYTYLWTTGDGNIISGTTGYTTTVNSGGTYNLLVTDTINGCTDTDSQLITVASIPPSCAITGPTEINCSTGDCSSDPEEFFGYHTIANSTPLNANQIVSIWSPHTYLTTELASFLTGVASPVNFASYPIIPGTYEVYDSGVKVMNIFAGTGSEATVRFSQVSTFVEWTNVIHYGTTTTGNLTYKRLGDSGSGGSTPCAYITLLGTTSTGILLTYEWKDGSNNVIGTDSTQVVTSADTYTLTVEDSFSATCVDVQAVTVNMAAPSVSISTTPTNVTEIDNNNSSIILTGPSGSFNYLWSTNETTQSITVTEADTYILTITDINNNGCTNNDSIVITESVLPIANIRVSQEASVVDCLDGLTIETLYVQTSGDVALLPPEYSTSCGVGGHGCDRGFWEVYGNGIYIGDSLLNNAGGGFGSGVQTSESGLYTCQDFGNTPAPLTGGSWTGSANARYSTMTIGQSTALDIADAGNGNVIDFSLVPTMTTYNVQCNGTFTPHNNVTWTRITDSDNNLLYNGCPNGNFLSLDVCSTSTTTIPVTGPVNLSCSITSITLDGATSINSAGGNDNLSYQWQKNGININGATNVDLVVTEAATYGLVVRDTTNNLSSLVATQVVGNISNSGNVTIGAPTGTVLNTANLQLIASVSGLSNKIYSWSTNNGTISGPTNTSNIWVTSIGTYNVIVTDSVTNCSASKSINITAPPIVDPESCAISVTMLGGNKLDCNTQNITLSTSKSGIPPFTYSWSTGSVNSSINISSDDTYSVMVTDSLGCTGTTSQIVTKDDSIPTISIIKTPNVTELDNGVSEILLSANTNASNTTFSWYEISNLTTIIGTQQTYNVTVGGTYRVYVTNTDNFCNNNTQVLITTDFPPPVVSISGAKLFRCDGSNITLNSSVSGSGTLFYKWTGGTIVSGGKSPSVVVSSPATYTLTVTDDNGSTSENYVVGPPDNAPVVNISAPTTQLTIGGKIRLTSSLSGVGFTYEWYRDGQLLIFDRHYMDADQSGTYTIIVIPFVPTCDEYVFGGTGTGTVNYIDCDGDPQSRSVSDSGPSGQEWEIFCASEIVNSSSSGVSLSNNGSCGFTPEPCNGTDSIIITAPDVPPTAKIASGDRVLNCLNNSSITLNGSSSLGDDLTYEWRKNQGSVFDTSPSIVVTSIGDYELTVIDGVNGLSDTIEITITSDTTVPTVNITPNGGVITTTGGIITLTATAGLSYLWSTAETTQSIDVIAGDTYSVTGTSVNGCSNSDSVVVTENIFDLTLSLAMATSGFEVNCANQTKTIVPIINGASGVISYRWYRNNVLYMVFSGDENAGNLTVSTSGVYKLIITNANNQNIAIDSVTIGGSTTLSPPTASIGTPSSHTNCRSILSSTSNNPLSGSLTHQWKNLTTNTTLGTGSTQIISTPGTYQLTVSNGCSDTTTRVVSSVGNIITVTIQTTTSIIFAGTPATLSATIIGGGGYTYLWTEGGGGATIVGGSPKTTTTIQASTGGTYLLEITDSIGCVGNASITLVNGVLGDTQLPTNVVNLQVVQPSLLVANLDITWNSAIDNVGIDHYELWVSQNGTAYTQISSPVGTSYTHTNLNFGTNYCYKVRAVDAAGNTSASFSNIDCATPFLGICEIYEISLNGQDINGFLDIIDCNGYQDDYEINGIPSGEQYVTVCSMTTPIVLSGDFVVNGPVQACGGGGGQTTPTCYSYRIVADGGYGDIIYIDCNGNNQSEYMDGSDIFGFPQRETIYVCSQVVPTKFAWQGLKPFIYKEIEC